MKTAIIADIHGNYRGLLAAFEDIQNCHCERIVCLGDLVDGGEENQEVISFIREHNIPCVRGNHDEFPETLLDYEERLFLKNLPEDILEENILYTHISPRKKKYSLKNEVEAWNAFDENDYTLVFIGHVHIPFLFSEKCQKSVSARVHPIIYNKPYFLDPKDRYLICVAPIGYSRDAVNQIRYTIYDEQSHSLETRKIIGPILNI